ncbi:glycosyltransferase family 2 protein [Ferruginibacter albus]|uniref:glycosyltransferase family 2 protein n=1 Tax=Ferruginibacter albus TaxID=2875540 RepID=UPI001CC35B20|nr:glycosyltransferase family 2 protein [Ferruginibacter albus]UAY52942.1 glycosyltransferase family 2 protein [Ferruginibacter albus]
MLLLKLFFWISLFIVFYSYIGYGIVLWIYLKIISLFKKKKAIPAEKAFEPEVTLIVATYNEEAFIRKKIENTFALNYPVDKLKLLFVADGSNDKTPDIIKEYPSITLLYKPEREGKIAAVNRAIPYVTTPYIIFSDANTLLNTDCVREIIKHYQNENIGAVAGEKKVVDASEKQNAAGAGEGLYWKYESFLKKLDAEFYTVVGAAGELFSVRTALYEHVPGNVLLDDFIISLRICQKGYKVMYEPRAFATEAPSMTMKDEQKRKIRISAGGFQSVMMLKDLLNIFKYGKLSFQYISHRVLRWCVCPFLLPLIFIFNILLYIHHAGIVYTALLAAQCLFYVAATTGWLMALRNTKIKALYVPYYFVFMNVALYLGLGRFLNKKQTVLWEKANRKV